MKKVLMGVSLIDHTLISDLFETSVVIDIFVVSGTDAEKQIFKSPADSALTVMHGRESFQDGEVCFPKFCLLI